MRRSLSDLDALSDSSASSRWSSSRPSSASSNESIDWPEDLPPAQPRSPPARPRSPEWHTGYWPKDEPDDVYNRYNREGDEQVLLDALKIDPTFLDGFEYELKTPYVDKITYATISKFVPGGTYVFDVGRFEEGFFDSGVQREWSMSPMRRKNTLIILPYPVSESGGDNIDYSKHLKPWTVWTWLFFQDEFSSLTPSNRYRIIIVNKARNIIQKHRILSNKLNTDAAGKIMKFASQRRRNYSQRKQTKRGRKTKLKSRTGTRRKARQKSQAKRRRN